MHIQRVLAIFEKDLKDFVKNLMISIVPLLPIVTAFMYSRMAIEGDEIPLFLMYFIVGMTFATATTGGIMVMIAEEKEKKTLRGITQSPATFGDIIIGKSLVTVLITVITLVISLSFFTFGPLLKMKVIIGLALLLLFFLLIGIGLGFLTNSVAVASSLLVPIMFLFGFTQMIEFFGLEEDSIVIKIANTFPIPKMVELHDSTSWSPLGIILLWVIGALLLTYVFFKRTIKGD